jgi:hypothetical protein
VTALSAAELRRRPKGARYSQRQLDDAIAGRLTGGKTRKGSAARQAVTRARYAKRIEVAERRRRSRPQARGHAGESETPASAVRALWTDVPTTAGIRDLETQGIESRRVGQYQRNVRELLEGRITPMAFRRRWRRRSRAAAGFELVSDPDQVLTMTFLAGPSPQERYQSLAAGVAR